MLRVPGGVVTAIILGLALLVACIAFERKSAVTGLRRGILLGARALTAGLLWLFVVQPVVRSERVSISKAPLALVFDDSRSLRVADGGRARRAQKLAAAWSQTAAGARAEWYALGESARAIEPAEVSALKAQAQSSRLWSALGSFEDRADQLAGVVLVSDGADTTDQPPPLTGTLPVHTVLLADDHPLRDESLAKLAADAVAFVRGEVSVRVRVRSMGLPARRGRLVLREEGVEVARSELPLDADADVTVELRFEARTLGRRVLELELSPVEGDEVPENNRRSWIMQVRRDRLRVLHVSGRPDWDQRFLRGFLKRDPAIDLIAFFILRSPADLTNSDPSELALIPFPTDELFREHLDSFDLVIMQNFDYAPYRMQAYLPLIRDYVLQGGALAMLGGALSFEGGDYAGTALSEVLPVQLDQRVPGADARFVLGAFRPLIAPGAERHPLVAVGGDPAGNLQTWKSASPLDGANRFLGLRAGAVALLQHPSERTAGSKMAVLAVTSAGKGRTLALGIDSSWHWSMPTAGVTGDAWLYDRFWDRALRWLVQDPALAPAQVDTDASSYAPGADIVARGLARDLSYAPLGPDGVSLRLMARAQTRAIGESVPALVDRDGAFSAKLRAPSAPGVLDVELRQGDTVLARVPVVVETGGHELAAPAPRPDLLEAVANATSGTFVRDTDGALDLSRFERVKRKSLGVASTAPLDSPYALLALMAAWMAEWALRRRLGAR